MTTRELYIQYITIDICLFITMERISVNAGSSEFYVIKLVGIAFKSTDKRDQHQRRFFKLCKRKQTSSLLFYIGTRSYTIIFGRINFNKDLTSTIVMKSAQSQNEKKVITISTIPWYNLQIMSTTYLTWLFLTITMYIIGI